MNKVNEESEKKNEVCTFLMVKCYKKSESHVLVTVLWAKDCFIIVLKHLHNFFQYVVFYKIKDCN